MDKTISKEAMVTLQEAIKKHRAFRMITKATKERGMNDGTGYSYSYVRCVILYEKFKNPALIDLAIDVIKEIRVSEEKLSKRIEKRIEKELVA